MKQRLGALRGISHQTSAGVFHADRWGIVWGSGVISELKIVASQSVHGRARLCMHPLPDDPHQEMLIVMSKRALERPQRRRIGFDTKVVLEGQAVLRYYSPDGSPSRSVELDCDQTCYVHTRSNEYHSLTILSEWFVFLEILEGPFGEGTTEFAPWSAGQWGQS